jgi:hypothetical protein
LLSTLNNAVKTDVQTSNEAAVHQLPCSTLPSPTATAKNRPVTPILGFVMNGDFVVLAARNKTGISSVGRFRKNRFAASLEPPKSSQRKTT